MLDSTNKTNVTLEKVKDSWTEITEFKDDLKNPSSLQEDMMDFMDKIGDFKNKEVNECYPNNLVK